jgi:hypothetical protein
MRAFAYSAVFTALLAFAAPASAQVSVGITIGRPPAPQAYRVPAPPGPEYVWVEGYWYPQGKHYKWHDGYWTRPPFNGAYWVQPYYYSGRYYQGYWEDGRRHINHDHRWDNDHDRRDDRRDDHHDGYHDNGHR